jgi:hypothetical protein
MSITFPRLDAAVADEPNTMYSCGAASDLNGIPFSSRGLNGTPELMEKNINHEERFVKGKRKGGKRGRGERRTQRTRRTRRYTEGRFLGVEEHKTKAKTTKA